MAAVAGLSSVFIVRGKGGPLSLFLFFHHQLDRILASFLFTRPCLLPVYILLVLLPTEEEEETEEEEDDELSGWIRSTPLLTMKQ